MGKGRTRQHSTTRATLGSREDEFFEKPKKSYKSIHKEGSFGNFIPLRDLLKKNHEDRVQDYLKEMDIPEGEDEKE